MTWLNSIFLMVAIGAAISLLRNTWRLGIGPLPSFQRSRQQLLNLIDPSASGRMLELGAGWGGLAFALAKRCPAAQVVGIELSLIPFLVCYLRQKIQRQTNLVFMRQDFFKISWAQADWLICYLCPQIMARIGIQAQRELAPGARIVTHTFALRGWQPQQQVRADDWYRSDIFLYVV
jgi:phospholipid N-methyltransferase